MVRMRWVLSKWSINLFLADMSHFLFQSFSMIDGCSTVQYHLIETLSLIVSPVVVNPWYIVGIQFAMDLARPLSHPGMAPNPASYPWRKMVASLLMTSPMTMRPGIPKFSRLWREVSWIQ